MDGNCFFRVSRFAFRFLAFAFSCLICCNLLVSARCVPVNARVSGVERL